MEKGATTAAAANANDDTTEQKQLTTIGQGRGFESGNMATERQQLMHNDSNTTTTTCDGEQQEQQQQQEEEVNRTTVSCSPGQQALTAKLSLQRHSSRLHERQQPFSNELQQSRQQQKKQQRLLNKYRFVRSPTLATAATAEAAAEAATAAAASVARSYKGSLLSKLPMRKTNCTVNSSSSSTSGNVDVAGVVSRALPQMRRSRYKLVRRRSAAD